MFYQGLEFKLTCSACPEQYDVYLDNKQVGYVWVGEFPNDICRNYHLDNIASAIHRQIKFELESLTH